MLTDENGSDVTYSQNVSANPTNVTQTESGTINPTETNDVIGTIQATIESGISKQEEKTALLEALQSLQRAKDRPSFLERTALFLGFSHERSNTGITHQYLGSRSGQFGRTFLKLNWNGAVC